MKSPVQFDPLQVAGVRGGGGFDHAEGAAFKSQGGGADVFHFNPLVGERRGVGLHFDDRAHEPGK
jgi:hypothetical protein